MSSISSNFSKLRIGFLGGGTMAQALIDGFLRSGELKAEQLVATTASANGENAQRLKSKGIATTTDNQAVAGQCDVLFVAVKPQLMAPLLNQIKPPQVEKNKLLISVAAGISLMQMCQWTNESFLMARVMPNTPVMVGSGVSAYCLGPGCEIYEDFLNSLLSCLGMVVKLPENLFDSFSGLAGCGPAFVYMAIESMAEGGVKMGLSRQMAIQLAAKTVEGAARMVIESGVHPAVLRECVESPGGSTATGVHVLEKCSVRNAFISAVEAAAHKCSAIGKGSGMPD